jgi:hypothetical protein
MNEAERLNMEMREIVRSFIYLLDVCEQHPNADIEAAFAWAKGGR